MSLKLHFPNLGWETITKNWSEWWAGELDRAIIVLECVEPKDEATPHYASTFLGNFTSEIPAKELLKMFAPRLESTYYLGDAYLRVWPNIGPGILAAFAGANLHAVQDTTWFSPNESGRIVELHVVMLPNDPWWQRVQDTTQAATDITPVPVNNERIKRGNNDCNEQG